MSDAPIFDRRAVRRSFDRASATYDVAAVLQAQVRGELLARLDLVRLEPQVVVDVGAGTGHASRALQRRYRRATVIALDLAPGMLRQARRQRDWFRRFVRICGDAERLPLAAASVDLLFSNLALQWCSDLDAVFGEFRRVLRPGGLVTFTTLGPGTLVELRAAWAAADGGSHVSPFADMHLIGDGLVRAGLAEPVLDVERHTPEYQDVRGLMRDLKASGAHNANVDRPRGLTSRRKLLAVEQAYERHRRAGLLPASYEVVFGHAWAPAGEPRRSRRSGEFTLPVTAIGRRGA